VAPSTRWAAVVGAGSADAPRVLAARASEAVRDDVAMATGSSSPAGRAEAGSARECHRPAGPPAVSTISPCHHGRS